MTACNGWFLSKSVADSGFIVADSELGDFAVANLLSPQADLAYRGDSTSAVTIQLNLKALESIDTLALCLHNMTSAASITIDLYDSRLNAALLSVTETVGGDTIPAYKNHVFSFAETAGVQEIDITITDTDNPDGYVQIRRLKLGLMTIPVTGFDFGYRFGFVSGEEYRAGEITWMWNTEAELNSMNELIRDFGVDPDKYARTRAGELLGFPDDILWIGYPESTNDTTKNQHIALVALVGADIPYRPNAAQGVFVARFEEVYYEPIVELPTAFVTIWKTTGAAETVTIPATGVNSFVVDWGDGFTELITTSYVAPSHEYADIGEYDISIEGICRQWNQNNSGDKLKIIELKQWGNVGFNQLEAAFYGCANMDITATDTPDVSIIEDFSYLFSGCTTPTDFRLALWDVSSGIDFEGMLYNCTGALVLQLEKWDVSNGERFLSMVRNCSGVLLFPVQNWDVSSGYDFQYMFGGCSSGTSFPVDVWDIGAATTMANMFNGSSLSDSNYDEILAGWSAQTLQSAVPFHAGTAKYTETAARAILTDAPNLWTITDGGAA